jgi:hypothetical protein
LIVFNKRAFEKPEEREFVGIDDETQEVKE